MTSADIRNGGFSNSVARARYEFIYNEDKHKLDFMEISDGISIDRLLAMIYPICKTAEKPPVVFIDYLKIAVNTDADSKDDLKSRIDY